MRSCSRIVRLKFCSDAVTRLRWPVNSETRLSADTYPTLTPLSSGGTVSEQASCVSANWAHAYSGWSRRRVVLVIIILAITLAPWLNGQAFAVVVAILGSSMPTALLADQPAIVR